MPPWAGTREKKTPNRIRRTPRIDSQPRAPDWLAAPAHHDVAISPPFAIDAIQSPLVFQQKISLAYYAETADFFCIRG
jgi:hypothetical protein